MIASRTAISTIRKLVPAVWAGVAALVAPAVCRAAALTPVLAQGIQTGTGVGRTYYIETLVMAVMFGAVLFVVCRSSRRQ